MLLLEFTVVVEFSLEESTDLTFPYAELEEFNGVFLVELMLSIPDDWFHNTGSEDMSLELSLESSPNKPSISDNGSSGVFIPDPDFEGLLFLNDLKRLDNNEASFPRRNHSIIF